jgi:Aspartyl aminopeptidase
MVRKNAWSKYKEEERQVITDFAENYKNFISECKTERECIDKVEKEAKANGYKDLKDIIKNKETLKSGDKIYSNNMGKAMALFHIGEKPLEEGMNILGAHVDSPRLDLKQNPLFEDSDLALLDTHYYGGIKKYQWVTIPLALHGIIVKKDGTIVNIVIGEDETDPVVGISDLLIHLSGEQMEKKANKVIEGENLDILVGSIPLDGEEKEPVKAYILNILKEKYNIEEEDFISAEIEVVPAGKARDYGLDRSMVMGYGHDDRVCAYPSYKALFDLEKVEKTCVCILVDKEEIGSVGATGMHSRFFENAVAELLNVTVASYSDILLRRAFQNSKMLSSDVTAAFDPNFPGVMEKKNASYLGKGLCYAKYTGARGKSGCNDANAEFMAEIRKVMDDNNIYYQTSELGKVDQGGGGTIAYILAQYNMEVIDSGISVLNMHSPWEIISKVDLYEGYLGYKAFLENM